MTTKHDRSTHFQTRLGLELDNARSNYKGEVNSCELQDGTNELAWRLDAIMNSSATLEVLETIHHAFEKLNYGSAYREGLMAELDERANAAVSNGFRNDSSTGLRLRNQMLAREWHRLWINDNGRRYFNDSHRGRFETAQIDDEAPTN